MGRVLSARSGLVLCTAALVSLTSGATAFVVLSSTATVVNPPLELSAPAPAAGLPPAGGGVVQLGAVPLAGGTDAAGREPSRPDVSVLVRPAPSSPTTFPSAFAGLPVVVPSEAAGPAEEPSGEQPRPGPQEPGPQDPGSPGSGPDERPTPPAEPTPEAPVVDPRGNPEPGATPGPRPTPSRPATTDRPGRDDDDRSTGQERAAEARAAAKQRDAEEREARKADRRDAETPSAPPTARPTAAATAAPTAPADADERPGKSARRVDKD